MITGFNTDIEYEGVVYHVQTEDKGLDSPVILSLVYSGGAILASKRSPYEDLIRGGYSDEALAERLKRQHMLICAAIHTGRINDLKKMSGRSVEPGSTGTISSEDTAPLELDDSIEQIPISIPFELEVGSKRSQEYQPPPPPTTVETTEVVADVVEKEEQVRRPSTQKPTSGLEPPISQEQGLVVRLLDKIEFYAGETPTLRVLVTNREGQQENPVGSAAVSIKVLGTAFRPLIYSLKTQKDGIATVSTQIPQFNSGRAAVLIKASSKDQAAEVRCIIHPAR